jgi:hypothetical protein
MGNLLMNGGCGFGVTWRKERKKRIARRDGVGSIVAISALGASCVRY